MSKSITVLDCGCGNGAYLNQVKHQIKPVSIDIDKKTLQQYRVKIGKQKAQVILASMDYFPFLKRELYDVILFLDSLEHCDNPEKVLSNSYAMLRKNGSLIITVPNWYNKLLSKAQSGHKHFHSSVGWKKLVKEAEFKIVKTTCLCFPLFDTEFFRNHLHILGFWIAIVGRK